MNIIEDTANDSFQQQNQTSCFSKKTATQIRFEGQFENSKKEADNQIKALNLFPKNKILKKKTQDQSQVKKASQKPELQGSKMMIVDQKRQTN